MNAKVKWSESEVIRMFAGQYAQPSSVRVGNGDDGAVLTHEPGEALVVTTDSLVEGIHFGWELTYPDCLGRKLVAINVSDVAAMGGAPRHIFLSLMLPPELDTSRLEEIARGVHCACREYDITVLGGNVSAIHGPTTMVGIVTGVVGSAGSLCRGFARNGDDVWVSGFLGDAAAGLHFVSREGALAGSKFEPYRRWAQPRARVELGRFLAEEHLATSLCDISDGLGTDLENLLKPAGRGAEVEAERIPISDPCRDYAHQLSASPLDWAISGGEDYELLFTAKPEARARLSTWLGDAKLTRIGRVVDVPTLTLLDENVRAPLGHGYRHNQ
ncbi:MAG: thiamine-phosphate kinase [Myxococcota bacterium]